MRLDATTVGFVLFLVAIGALALVVPYIERRRDAAYRAFCASRGFDYVARRDGAERQYTDLVPIFGVGSARTWRHEISGRIGGLSFSAFEFSYRTQGGRYPSFSRNAMVRWDLPGADLPNFNVLPADFFYFIGTRRPPPALTVPDDPAFSRQFIAVGRPESLPRILGPEVRAAMISRWDQHLAGSGDVLFWWIGGRERLPGPDSMDAFLEMAAVFARALAKSGGSATSA